LIILEKYDDKLNVIPAKAGISNNKDNKNNNFVIPANAGISSKDKDLKITQDSKNIFLSN
jgi:hypothetical protein